MIPDRKKQIFIWGSTILSIILYALIINFVETKKNPPQFEFNKDIFLILGGVFAVIPYVIKNIKSLQSIAPLGVIIAEVPAIIGLGVYFAFSDKSLALRLIAISFASTLFLFPARKKEQKEDDFKKPSNIT